MRSVTVGDLSIGRVEEMFGPGLPPDQMFPEFDQEEWDQHRALLGPTDYDPETNTVGTYFQTWVVKAAGRTILVDTGVGNHKERPDLGGLSNMETPYLEHMRAGGVEPDDVEFVVCTHLH